MSIKGRGALIVIEGIDRTGKSTQCDRLKKALITKGHPAKLMKFPDRTTTIGQMIDSYLKEKNQLDDHVVHLLFSANRWEASEGMKSDLLKGTTLIVDRYAYSGVAYTGAKKGMDFNWCKSPDSGLPKPDVVMFLNLTPEETQRRSGFGDERYEKSEFQNLVLKNFMSFSSDDNWKNVDASGSIEQVHEELCGIAEKTIETAKFTDIKKLWTEFNSSGTK